MEKVQRISLPLCRWRAVAEVFGSLDARELGDFLVAVCHREEKEAREDLMEPVRDELFQLGVAAIEAAVPEPGEPDPRRALLATDADAHWEFITPGGRRVVVAGNDVIDVIFPGGSVNAAAALLLALANTKADGRLPYDNLLTVYTTAGGRHRVAEPENFMQKFWATSDLDVLWRLRWDDAMTEES